MDSLNEEGAEIVNDGVKSLGRVAVVSWVEIALYGHEEFVQVCLDGEGFTRLPAVHRGDHPAGGCNEITASTIRGHLERKTVCCI